MSPTVLVDGVRRPTANSEGKRIARTEEAVRNFWRWFRDSKVVDGQGRPRVMYHGTTSKSGFSEFRSGYFTSERERANSYTEDFDPFLYGTLDNVQAGVVYPVYVRLENPAVRPEGGAGSMSEIPNGRDGVMGLGRGGRGIVAVVSSPAQIKSATGNRGTFDLGDPVITNPGRGAAAGFAIVDAPRGSWLHAHTCAACGHEELAHPVWMTGAGGVLPYGPECAAKLLGWPRKRVVAHRDEHLAAAKGADREREAWERYVRSLPADRNSDAWGGMRRRYLALGGYDALGGFIAWSDAERGRAQRTNPGRILQAEIPRIPDDYAVQAKLAALTDDELLTDKHFRLQDAQDEIRDRAIAAIMAEQPFDGLVIPLREHAGTFAIVAPFVKQRGVKAWQATNFDARGPWTDTVARTVPELLRDIYLHYKADFHKTKVVRKR